MTPLAIVKYMVEHLEGTSYQPWVNALLFLLFVAAIGAAVSLLLGRGGRAFVAKVSVAAAKSIANRKGYAPEWESVRQRVEPYVELVGSMYYAFVGFYSAALVGLAAAFRHANAPWWAVPLATVWVLASFFYMRVNLEAASWAYHRIKKRNC